MISLVEKPHLVNGLYVREVSPVKSDIHHGSILMVPGGSHGWWAYEEWLPFFALTGRRALAMSLRNHTGSYPVSLAEYLNLGLQDYVDDVLTVVEWIADPLVLLGHSMGGIIAIKAAEVLNLKALILAAPVGPGQLGSLRPPLPIDRPVMHSKEDVRRFWFNNIDDQSFDDIYSRLVPESPSVINEYSSGDLCVDKESITCPILVVGGEYDHSAAHKSEAVANFFNADLITIKDTGHDIMLEPTARVSASQICDWLATH